MDKKVSIKEIAPAEFFETKPNAITSLLAGHKLGFIPQKIELVSSNLFVCNKTTPNDKQLISLCLKGNYVFLRDEIIQQIHNKTLKKEKKTALMKSFKNLKENAVSVVVFPEKHTSIFGETSILPIEVTEFLFETTLNLKFLYLIGTYFAHPLWSANHNTTTSKLICQFALSHAQLEEDSPAERNRRINGKMPSSASVYSHNNPMLIRSNTRAQNLETLVYACPHCKELFSMYSEFNCLKCSNCGTAIEISNDGKINLSKNISTFDDFPEFLFETLSQKTFNINSIQKYENLKLLATDNSPATTCSLEIFSDKIKLTSQETTKTYHLENVEEIYLSHKNIANIKLKNEEISIQGKNKENFYILLDLLKMNKN